MDLLMRLFMGNPKEPCSVLEKARGVCPDAVLDSGGDLHPNNPGQQVLATTVVTFRVLAIITICVCAWVLTKSRSIGDDNPLSKIPGPLSLPLIGSVLSIGKTPHLKFTAFRKKYGDVFRIQVGSVPVVVLNGIDTIREATITQGDVFSGRPDLFTFRLASEGKSMAFNSFSPTWKVHHRLAERALKMMLTEGQFLKTIVCKEAGIFVSNLLKKTKSGPYNPISDITWSVAHVMYSLCYGDSRKATDFKCLIHSTLRLIHCHKLGNALNFFPWARYFLRHSYRELQELCGSMIHTTKRQEREHLDTYKEGVLRDAMDALIRVGVKRQCPLDKDRVLHTVQEFIGAGTDTLYLSLSWAVLYLLEFPDIRRKVLHEVDLIIGQSREPSGEDMKSMPYTYAFIMETLRYSTVVPLALPHSTLADTTLQGYKIPSGTFILINLHSIQKDPELWGDPETFRPERFIRETGELNEKQLENCCPYGFGRRKCVGESLSKQKLFIYIAVLLQKCKFFRSGKCQDLCPQGGIVLGPKPYTLHVCPR